MIRKISKQHINFLCVCAKANALGVSFVALTPHKTHILCWLDFRAAEARCVRAPATDADKAKAKKQKAEAKKEEAEAKRKEAEAKRQAKARTGAVHSW